MAELINQSPLQQLQNALDSLAEEDPGSDKFARERSIDAKVTVESTFKEWKEVVRNKIDSHRLKHGGQMLTMSEIVNLVTLYQKLSDLSVYDIENIDKKKFCQQFLFPLT